jgi:hypothetical protein
MSTDKKPLIPKEQLANLPKEAIAKALLRTINRVTLKKVADEVDKKKGPGSS